MLSNATLGNDEIFRIDGQPLVQVTFVGLVVHVDDNSNTNISYKIDDGTGIMDVKYWLETDENGQQNRDVQSVHSYVRVYGHLRNWQNNLNVVAFRITPLGSSNEICYHFLDVIRVHLFHTKGPLPKLAEGVAAGSNPQFSSSSSSTQFVPPHQQQYQPQQQHQHYQQQQHFQQPARLENDCQIAISEVLSTGPLDIGVNFDDLVNALRSTFPFNVVKENLERLVTDGLAFTTVDNCYCFARRAQ